LAHSGERLCRTLLNAFHPKLLDSTHHQFASSSVDLTISSNWRQLILRVSMVRIAITSVALSSLRESLRELESASPRHIIQQFDIENEQLEVGNQLCTEPICNNHESFGIKV
jgi:hypothetical protein